MAQRNAPPLKLGPLACAIYPRDRVHCWCAAPLGNKGPCDQKDSSSKRALCVAILETKAATTWALHRCQPLYKADGEAQGAEAHGFLGTVDPGSLPARSYSLRGFGEEHGEPIHISRVYSITGYSRPRNASSKQDTVSVEQQVEQLAEERAQALVPFHSQSCSCNILLDDSDPVLQRAQLMKVGHVRALAKHALHRDDSVRKLARCGNCGRSISENSDCMRS